MFGAYQKYLDHKRDAKSAPRVEVTEEEMVRLFVEAGHTEEKAKFQTFICKTMGSEVLIGGRMVGLK